MNKAPRIGAIEAGGTKILVAFGSTPDDFRNETITSVPTSLGPSAVVKEIARLFADSAIEAIGIASFGPIDLHTATILRSPKSEWNGFSWRTNLHQYFPEIPIGIDTDVNGAALAEARWGDAAGLDVALYVTVGTGIGGGITVNGAPLHGQLHPEMGHLRIPHLDGDDFPGSCPFHGRCWEGLASGSAIKARWHIRGEDLPSDHIGWTLESKYLALGLMNVMETISPNLITVGGGVMRVQGLLESVRHDLGELVAAYPISPASTPLDLKKYVVAPSLGERSGLLGGFAIGSNALASSSM